MENREIVKEEFAELLENYYNGSFVQLVSDYIRSTEMTQKEVKRMLEEVKDLLENSKLLMINMKVQ